MGIKSNGACAMARMRALSMTSPALSRPTISIIIASSRSLHQAGFASQPSKYLVGATSVWPLATADFELWHSKDVPNADDAIMPERPAFIRHKFQQPSVQVKARV